MTDLSLTGDGTRRRSRISLTPLIDVVFILLLFYMLVANFEQQSGLIVEIPDSKVIGSGSKLSTASVAQPISIHIEENQRVVLAGNVSTLEDLPREINNIQLDGDTYFRVTYESSVSVQTVISVLDSLQTVEGASVQLDTPL